MHTRLLTLLRQFPAPVERAVIASAAVLGVVGCLVDPTVRSIIPLVAAVGVVFVAGHLVRRRWPGAVRVPKPLERLLVSVGVVLVGVGVVVDETIRQAAPLAGLVGVALSALSLARRCRRWTVTARVPADPTSSSRARARSRAAAPPVGE